MSDAQTPGEAAYMADLAAQPTYHTGVPRKPWAALGALERGTWERNPTPRSTPFDDPEGNWKHDLERGWTTQRASTTAQAAPYRVDLTAAGEQSVIPGCERDAAPGVRQLDLF